WWRCSALGEAYSPSCYGHRRELHSFPTRRSSDLTRVTIERKVAQGYEIVDVGPDYKRRPGQWFGRFYSMELQSIPDGYPHLHHRSEEHTSELQSRENLVCRLLLEKKK